ncbi:MAG: hypothetical protein ABIH24_08230 [Verrucomicrobiota bacterium]
MPKGMGRRQKSGLSFVGWRTGLLLLVALAAIALRMYVASVGLKYIPITADEAITVLQAQRVLKGAWPLLVMAQPYEFPAEAYATSLWARFALDSVLGARCLAFATGFFSLFILLRIFRSLWPVDRENLAVLLLLFPSAYVLMTQFGCAIPHYNLPAMLCWLVILVALKTAEDVSPGALAIKCAAGVLGGLAFSETMLSAALLVPAFMVLCLRSKWRTSLVNAALIAMGAFLGLVPFFAALSLYPGAHAAVAGFLPMTTAIARLVHLPLGCVLPGVLGVAPPVYADSPVVLDFMTKWRWSIVFVFIVILIACTTIRIFEIGGQYRRTRRWPGLSGIDAFMGMAWLGLILFSLSKRAGPSDYRYLLPVAWSFPFLAAELHAHVRGWPRRIVGGGIVLLAVFNVATIIMLVARWKAPDYAADKVGAPDLGPVIEFLNQEGIRHCVSAHWQAYRINYLSHETILCCQPFNERFMGWPLPYKDEVDASRKVAYVLSARHTRGLTPALFEWQLKAMGMTARKSVQSAFSVYYDFSCPAVLDREAHLPVCTLIASASHNARDTQFLADGIRRGSWTTKRCQEQGMWVQVAWTNAALVSRLVFVYDRNNRHSFDCAIRMNIRARDGGGGGWGLVGEGIRGAPDPFEIGNRHPVYGTWTQSVGFDPPVMSNALRVEIAEPSRCLWWTLREIEVYCRRDVLARDGLLE